MREVPAVSSPSETPVESTAPSGLIHDLGYRPYTGPRLGPAAIIAST